MISAAYAQVKKQEITGFDVHMLRERNGDSNILPNY